MHAGAFVLAVIAVLILGAGSYSLASEQRYRSCVATAEARYPVLLDPSGDGYGELGSGQRAAIRGLDQRRVALATCRRRPW